MQLKQPLGSKRPHQETQLGIRPIKDHWVASGRPNYALKSLVYLLENTNFWAARGQPKIYMWAFGPLKILGWPLTETLRISKHNLGGQRPPNDL